ncbi:MAG: transposase [Mesorhizobium sp.]|nr:MAG: transposase [Mesorhizobium sp.]
MANWLNGVLQEIRSQACGIREWVLPQIERRGPIRAWIVDDTGFPKKGKH